jgi:four helix bundle protein
MKYLFSFEKLNVWVASKDLALLIYKSSEGFPKTENFGLVNQIRRSSISVSSNIAEGNSRKSKTDRLRFFNIAYSSMMEMLSQSIIGYELGFITSDNYHKIRELSNEISNKLIALMNNQQTFK